MDIEVEAAVERLPLIGDEAPAFSADTTMGPIDFPADYKGKWVIFFSHPADFTPVCTSEIATFAALKNDFAGLDAKLLGLSVDSAGSHLAWVKNIQDRIRYNEYNGQPIDFPIVADLRGEVARRYGMIQPGVSDTKAVRAVFVIDPKGIVRAIVYYPLSTGRNLAEIKRLLQALQTSDRYGVATPADWKPGDAVLIPAPTDIKGLYQRIEKTPDNLTCQDWFFCTRLDSDV